MVKIANKYYQLILLAKSLHYRQDLKYASTHTLRNIWWLQVLISYSFQQDFRVILIAVSITISQCITLIKSIPVSPPTNKTTLPRIILVSTKDAKVVAKQILELLPSVNITMGNHFILRRDVQHMFQENSGIPCPSTKHVVYMSNDMYEVKKGLVDKEGVAFFEKVPQYYDERCLIEDKTCCKTQTKCKTKEELKSYVKLKMRGGKLQLASGTSNDIKRINVGKYCKCQS